MLLLLHLVRAGPSTLIVGSSLYPALAPQKFFNFLRTIRVFRSIERAIARDEWLSHGRMSVLRRYMLRLLLLLLLLLLLQ